MGQCTVQRKQKARRSFSYNDHKEVAVHAHKFERKIFTYCFRQTDSSDNNHNPFFSVSDTQFLQS
jgi:hypothetical protein